MSLRALFHGRRRHRKLLQNKKKTKTTRKRAPIRMMSTVKFEIKQWIDCHRTSLGSVAVAVLNSWRAWNRHPRAFQKRRKNKWRSELAKMADPMLNVFDEEEETKKKTKTTSKRAPIRASNRRPTSGKCEAVFFFPFCEANGTGDWVRRFFFWGFFLLLLFVARPATDHYATASMAPRRDNNRRRRRLRRDAVRPGARRRGSANQRLMNR